MSNRSLNKVMLLGNLAAEPEYKVLNSNTAVATVSMATNETYKDAQGNTQDKTEWHKLVFWSKLADVVHQYLHKGSQVYVEGKLRTRDYTDQNGQKKYVTEIQVTELIMLGGAQTQPQGQYPQQQPQGYTGVYTQQQSYPPGYAQGYPQGYTGVYTQQQSHPQQSQQGMWTGDQGLEQPQRGQPQPGYMPPPQNIQR